MSTVDEVSIRCQSRAASDQTVLEETVQVGEGALQVQGDEVRQEHAAARNADHQIDVTGKTVQVVLQSLVEVYD